MAKEKQEKVGDEASVTPSDLKKLEKKLEKMMERKLDEFSDDLVSTLKPDDDECECGCGEDHELECGCPECTGVGDADSNMARYIIFSGGQKYPATDVKPNPLVGVDFYLHEVDPKTGKEYNSKGTITSPDVVILDLKPEMTLEMFSAIKQQTIDYVVQQAQEAQAKDAALKAAAANSTSVPDCAHQASYT